MTSLINATNIDITYPIAGQDNDTQGFRTNFTNIQNNLAQAAVEITALQSNVGVLQTGVFTGNLTTTANLIVSSITSPAGTGGNITIDPDGAGDVVFPVQTEIWVRSTAVNAITVSGGISLASALQFANLTTAQITAITPTNRGMTVYNYNTGNIQVYNGTKWANVTLS
jgi:hypothetical protein